MNKNRDGYNLNNLQLGTENKKYFTINLAFHLFHL